MNNIRNIRSIVETGKSGLIIEVECQLSNNLPSITIVGYANKAVDEAKERIRSAFESSKISLPRKRIIINLAPADIPKDSTSFDLAIAASILVGTGQGNIPADINPIIMGELGLNGTIRPIRGIIGKLIAGKKHGVETFIIPSACLSQAVLVPDVKLIALETLSDLYQLLNNLSHAPVIDTADSKISDSDLATEAETIDICDIIGQDIGKRAIEISAAGGHNLLLGGPPGTGKTMLAKTLVTLLPDMTREEMLEVTHIHSLASSDFNRIISKRPFRSPHHSASNVAIVGGGNNVKPGEMSLSHRGVLLFDELPEFDRQTIEALRQPLENRIVSISRAKESADYPAHFIFIATANPCPCGFYGTKKACVCMPSQISKYRRKLSGPILDRIDLYVDVHEIDNSQLLGDRPNKSRTSSDIKQAVSKARYKQSSRLGSPRLNTDMTNREMKSLISLSPDAKKLIDAAAEKFSLSSRAYMRSLKVARTIADLDNSDEILPKHVAEALQYRPHQFSER